MADLHVGDGGFRNNLERYWKFGAGAAKVRYGTPGDWTRLYHGLLPHVGPERAKRIASQWIKDVTGRWNGEEFGKNPLGPG